MFKVTNGYIDGWIGVNKLYIGRANNKLNLKCSVLANPYILDKDGTREEVIEKYRLWLNKQVNERNKIYDYLVNLAQIHKSPDEFELVCDCSPKPCHGDIIIRALNWIIKQQE